MLYKIKNNLKTVISMFLIACLLIPLSGCGNSIPEEKEKSIKDDVYAIYEEIKSKFTGASSEMELANVVIGWAKKNKINYTRLKSGSLLLSATKDTGRKAKKDTIMQCSLGGSNYKSQAEYTAIALATLKNSDVSKKADLILTPANSYEYYGAKQDKKMITSYKHIISMNYSPKVKLFTGSAETGDYRMSLPLTYERTKGTKTYKVSITGVNKNVSFDDPKMHTNPLDTLGKFLNRLKSNNIIFQVCDFEGGNSAGTYAQHATVNITVTANYEDRLLSALESEQEDFENNASDDGYGGKFDFTSTDVPYESYSQKNSDSLMSLIYTLNDGIYNNSKDNEEPLTIANLGKVSYINGELVFAIKAMSIDLKEMKKMEGDYKKTASLCDFTFKKLYSYKMWATGEYQEKIKQEQNTIKTDNKSSNGNTNSRDQNKTTDEIEKSKDISNEKEKTISKDKSNTENTKSGEATETPSMKDAKKYMDAANSEDLNLKPRWSFHETECALFYNANKKCGIILIGGNIQNGFDVSKSLVTYIKSLSEK